MVSFVAGGWGESLGGLGLKPSRAARGREGGLGPRAGDPSLRPGGTCSVLNLGGFPNLSVSGQELWGVGLHPAGRGWSQGERAKDSH